MPMPYSTSPHDNTPDAREALWNRYYAFLLAIKPSRSTSGSPPSSSKRRSSTRRGYAQQGNAVPVPRPPSQGARALGVEAYENAKRRPSDLAPEMLWFGIEPDVDATFSRWGCSDEPVPTDSEETLRGAIRNAIQEFEAGKELGKMSPESKAALVYRVAQEMLEGGMSSSYARPPQTPNFLSELCREMVKDPQLVVQGHWTFGPSIRINRTEELKWLEFQAELRQWKVIRKKMDPRRMAEALEGEVKAMFESYTHHFELP